MILGYRCSLCQNEYGLEEITYTCPLDGGNLDVVYDWRAVSRRTSPSKIGDSAEASIWRYLPLLPVEDPGHTGSTLRAVGWTPLFAPARLRQSLGLPHLWLKDDSRNPTASFKDRASAVVIARAQAIRAETVVTASTGNAGAALAGMAAAVGMAAVILAPRTAPPAKVAQLLIFGARVFLVEGSYDDAFDLTCEAIEAFGWYSRNTGQNPFTAEGKKTAALEIAEQFSLATAASGKGGMGTGWVVPDAIFVSVGDGNIIAGLHKGFKDLLAMGWIERIPRLFGVQSTASAPIYNVFVSGEEKITRVQAATVADSISVGLPRDGIRGLRAATQTGGAYLAVADEAILDFIRALARSAGVFAEPAGAASYAGLVQALQQGLVSELDSILVFNTGNGLKDVRSAMQVAGQATVVEPRLEALRSAMG